MTLLLDTHAFLWMLNAPEKLSKRVAQAHDDDQTLLYVSVVSLWEIQIKHAIGKLEMDIPLSQVVDEQIQNGRFAILDIRAPHVLELDNLAQAHNDPFDRLLVAQSRVEKWPLVSNDSIFAKYPVEQFW